MLLLHYFVKIVFFGGALCARSAAAASAGSFECLQIGDDEATETEGWVLNDGSKRRPLVLLRSYATAFFEFVDGSDIHEIDATSLRYRIVHNYPSELSGLHRSYHAIVTLHNSETSSAEEWQIVGKEYVRDNQFKFTDSFKRC